MNSFLKKKVTIRQKQEKIRRIIVSNSFRAVLLVFMVVFGFLYVWQTNTVSTKGYIMSDLEKSIRTLENETQRLEVDIAKNKSMQSIQGRLSQTDLIAFSNVDYVTVVGSAVAKR